MRRVALAVVLASLVVLAGCGGTGGSPTATQTSTATDTPTDTPTQSPTPTPTPDPFASVEYPDGASADGFTAPGGVARNQRRLLNDTSYTLQYEEVAVSGPQEGDSAVVRTTYSPDRSVTTIDTSQGGTDSNVSIFSGPEETVLQSSNETTTGYTYYERNASITATFYRFYGLQIPGQFTGQYLRAFNYDVVGTEQRGGHTYIEYESTGVNESFVGQGGTPGYTAGDLRIVLRDDGLVTAVEGSVTADGEAGETTRELSYQVTDVGSTTVERPTWLVETVPSVTAEPVAGGQVMAITNEGPTDLDGGTIEIRMRLTGQTTFDDLASGETIYVTARQDGGGLNMTVHDERPTPRSGDLDFTSAERMIVSVLSNPFQYVLDGRADEE
jgi:hypothetical protein